jgi:hypothetical protein
MAIYLGFLITEVVQAFGEKGREVVKEAARKGGLWQEMGIPEILPEFCILATYYDLGPAQAFDPDITIELTEDMVRGNCECIYVFKTLE